LIKGIYFFQNNQVLMHYKKFLMMKHSFHGVDKVDIANLQLFYFLNKCPQNVTTRHTRSFHMPEKVTEKKYLLIPVL